MDAIYYGRSLARALTKNIRGVRGHKQELDIYYDEKFAQSLETWGEDNAWREVQFLFGNREGKVLDLACGTGRTYDFIQRFKSLEYYGCDISEFLINKAIKRGISSQRVTIQDATNMNYENKFFDYVFSIGSLEHFTVEGLLSTVRECNRICSGLNFHHFPVSRSGLNEGWLVTKAQSYWNNSESWWLELFKKEFGQNVWVLNSHWKSRMSRGIWVVCASPEFLR